MTRFDAWALGYPDELCVRPGETVRFHVSGAGSETVEAQLVKLIHGDTQPGGPGFREVEVPSGVDGAHPLREQPTQHGSYARIPSAASVLAGTAETGVSLCAMVQPRADTGAQPLFTAWDAATETGMALVLEPGLHPAFWITGTRVALSEPLISGVWYLVCGSFDPARDVLAIRAVPVVNSYNSRFGPVTHVAPGAAEASAVEAPEVPDVDLLLGAFDASDGRTVRGAYNGKLALPTVYAGALGEGQLAALAGSGARPAVGDRLRAWWDLTEHIDTSVVSSAMADAPDGHLVNHPTRAVTAHNWDGSCHEWRHAPDLYGAVHFHDDDIDDVGWEATCALDVPDDLASGVYALRLRAAGFEDHTPFFVRAAPGRESPVALVLPTASYLAYGNEHLATAAPMGQAIVGHTPALQPLDLLLMEHPELGLSMYELHGDGSGVAFSSRRRPILNMRPRHRFSFLGTWQFPSDLYLVDWLESRGTPYDVLIDEDLHREGVDALRPYRAVITGSHPEYASEEMLDAYESYVTRRRPRHVDGRQRLLLGDQLLGREAVDHGGAPRRERRPRVAGGARVRPHTAPPARRAGIWRNRGRPPQKLFGTGFTSEGYAGSFPYHRMPDGELPEMSWMFEGVVPDEPIGDFGLVGGGAAGQEIDRADVTLGTPPHTYLVASAQNQNDSYKVVPEEIDFMFDGVGGTEHPNVRADLTYFEAPGGGAVFATSSIAWSGALSHARYDNNISRITGNVLDRFIMGGGDG